MTKQERLNTIKHAVETRRAVVEAAQHQFEINADDMRQRARWLMQTAGQWIMPVQE